MSLLNFSRNIIFSVHCLRKVKDLPNRQFKYSPGPQPLWTTMYPESSSVGYAQPEFTLGFHIQWRYKFDETRTFLTEAFIPSPPLTYPIFTSPMCKSSLSITFCSKCKTTVSMDKDINSVCMWQKRIKTAQLHGSAENVEEWEALCQAGGVEVSGPCIRLYGCKYC